MRNYNRSAKVYDAQYAKEQGVKIEAALKHVVLKESSLVLDVGCGTGLLFEHVGESVELLVGLDISLRILQEAKKRVKRFREATLIRADADFMPFLSQIFDMTFAITLLQNIPNPLQTLHEMKRVSKRPSIMVVSGLKKEFAKKAFIRLFEEARLKPTVIRTDAQSKGYIVIIEL